MSESFLDADEHNMGLDQISDSPQDENEKELLRPTGRFPETPEPWARTAIALASSGWGFDAIAEMLPDKTERDVRDAINRYQSHVAATVKDLDMPVEQLFRGLLPKAIDRYHKILDNDEVSPAVHARVAGDVVDRIHGRPTQRRVQETRAIQVQWNDIPGNAGEIGTSKPRSLSESGLEGNVGEIVEHIVQAPLDGPLGDVADEGG